MLSQDKTQKISVYIHWPYCKSLCPYCDFNSHLADEIDHNLWLKAYIKEIEHFTHVLQNKYIQSIFFGGGTPSLMDPMIAEGVIDKLSRLGKIDEYTEINIEANPTSYEMEKFKQFRSAGINRISLGVQALNDKDLLALGRQHSARQALKAVESASSIFERYSFDLIYCRPGQNVSLWEAELRQALTYARDHLSLYQLTIEKGTPFYSQHKQGKLILPENDIAANMYEITTNILAEQNLARYEISNYAVAGQECRHNLAYWHYDEYLGIGPGAHSRLHQYNKIRNQNAHQRQISAMMMHHTPQKWLNNILENGSAVQQLNPLSRQEIVEEVLMMGLRLETGISTEHIESITSQKIENILNMPTVKQYSDNGYLHYLDNNIRLTSQGLIVHNYIVPRIMLDIT